MRLVLASEYGCRGNAGRSLDRRAGRGRSTETREGEGWRREQSEIRTVETFR
jgi:hypothetical protein